MASAPLAPGEAGWARGGSGAGPRVLAWAPPVAAGARGRGGAGAPAMGAWRGDWEPAPGGGWRARRVRPAVAAGEPWLEAFPGWSARLAEAPAPGALRVDEGDEWEFSAPGASLVGLEAAVGARPAAWTAGGCSGGEALAEGQLGDALRSAGELLALQRGLRGLTMTQLHVGWDADQLPSALRPFAPGLLRELAEDPDVEVVMSELEGSLTAILCCRREPWCSYARHLASFGCQAALEAGSPFYRVLVGRLLGYAEENVVAHVEAGGWTAGPAVLQAVEEELAGLSAAPPRLPWRRVGPRGAGPGGRRRRPPHQARGGVGGGGGGFGRQ